MIVGTICYTTKQGIAHLARDFYSHGIIQRVLTISHPHYQDYPERYPQSYSVGQVDEFSEGLDILLLFETGINWQVVGRLALKGVRIVLMVMYEYSPFPFPVKVDLYLCPSLLDMEVYSRYSNKVFIPVPVDQPWNQREKALTFVHNAGHGQWEYGKGTPEVIQAMDYVKSPIKMLIRCQPGEERMYSLYSKYKNHPRLDFRMGDFPDEELYKTGDVFINAERLNGLSLPLQEAYASGMLVMTTNRFPTNTWLPNEPMIPVKKYEKCRIATTFDRAVVDSKDIAKVIDLWYGKDITGYSLKGKQWAEDHSWSVLGPKYLQVMESVL